MSVDADIQFPLKPLYQSILQNINIPQIKLQIKSASIKTKNNLIYSSKLNNNYLGYRSDILSLRNIENHKLFKEAINFADPYLYLKSFKSEDECIIHEIMKHFQLEQSNKIIQDSSFLKWNKIDSPNSEDICKNISSKYTKMNGIIIFGNKPSSSSDSLENTIIQENNRLSLLLGAIHCSITCGSKGSYLILRLGNIFAMPTVEIINLINSIYEYTHIYRPSVGAGHEGSAFLIGQTKKDISKLSINVLETMQQVQNQNIIHQLFSIKVQPHIKASIRDFESNNQNYQCNKLCQIKEIINCLETPEENQIILDHIKTLQRFHSRKWARSHNIKLNDKIDNEEVKKQKNAVLRNFFPKFDPMLKVSEEGKYSITKGYCAHLMQSHIQGLYDTKKLVITDGTGGNVGDSIRFASYFKRVQTVEYNKDHCDIIKHNAKILDIKNMTVRCGSFLNVLDNSSEGMYLQQDVIFLDPPWGGNAYRDTAEMILHLDDVPMNIIISTVLRNKQANCVFIKVPYNFDVRKFVRQAADVAVTMFDCHSFFLLHAVLSSPYQAKIKGGKQKNALPKTLNFELTVVNITSKSEQKLKQYFKKYSDYRPWPEEESINIDGVTRSQALSYRRQLLRTKYIKTAYILKQNQNKIYKEYSKNPDILKLAQKYDMPPMAVFQRVIKEKYHMSFQEVWNAKPPGSCLDKVDFEQFLIAEKYDCIEGYDPSKVLEQSDGYEDKVGQWLDDKGIKYITQETLVQQQTKEYGKPLWTPDFLLDSPIKINGFLIYWIECKNFYATTESILWNKVSDQANKYIKKFGTGALAFSCGGSIEARIPDTIIVQI